MTSSWFGMAEGWAGSDPKRWLLAAAITLAFAVVGRGVRGVNASGAMAGAVAAFLILASVGLGGFAALGSVFALASVATQLGYDQKQALGTAERKDGRSAGQVLANLGVAAVCAVGFAALEGRVWLVASMAALAEAAADTVSSEYGQARSARARLITTWNVVPAGTDGAITLAGTLAGVIAAALVATVCALTGVIRAREFGVVIVAAVAGSFADSYLGALVERRGTLGNNAVNLLSTLAAAGVAAALARAL